MFQVSSVNLQEDTVVHVQHMILPLSMKVLGCLSVHSLSENSVLTQVVYRQATTNSHREWQYHRLHVYNCILLKMSTWGLKHVEENIILWINNNWCFKLVIIIYIQFMMHNQKNIKSVQSGRYLNLWMGLHVFSASFVRREATTTQVVKVTAFLMSIQ